MQEHFGRYPIHKRSRATRFAMNGNNHSASASQGKTLSSMIHLINMFIVQYFRKKKAQPSGSCFSRFPNLWGILREPFQSIGSAWSSELDIGAVGLNQLQSGFRLTLPAGF
jgi:hypothetical protein